ncbi:FHA domain-containing protein [Fuerstiella marisgermanici]|uniref:Type VI secretion system FHA domain protein n=1 Tax=Fuerstiella marisgermanici TaxID=1891926 RepID=A0A1P8WL53_9PLAN|nr:FHA domain-containing protein [Fuerstiella marisgermanici]APZ94790.1 type VI secretion system FHA domain protein [Fuerstiella marisgermanici]
MKVVLELQDQPSNIKKVTVRHDIVIGRGADCNLRLSAPQVSRRHCFLRISEDSATVTDLESSNGTYLNGQRLTSSKRYTLEDGASLAIGPVQFTIRVLSEVLAPEVLEVGVNDARIESESAQTDGGTPPDNEVAAAAAGGTGANDPSSMNFAIESGGHAADEDDPTTDYLATDSADGDNQFDDGSDSVVSIIDDRDVPPVEPKHTSREPDTIASSANGGIGGRVDAELADDGFELLSADEVQEVDAEDETVNIEGDDAAGMNQDFLHVADDELLVDEDDVSPELPAADRQSSSDENLEDDLRDFLNGLD